MEYGNKSIHAEKLYLYQGFDPATENYPANQIDIHPRMDVVNQRSADLVFMWDRVSLYLLLFPLQELVDNN